MKKQKGFTLIEMMIVVAIIGILSAIAMPSYDAYIKRGRIVEAVSALADMQIKMEQLFQDERSYANACGTNKVAPAPADTNFFEYSCIKDSTTYTVTATGRPAMSGFVYSINQKNERKTLGLPTGWTASTTCWVLKKDGSC